MGGCDGPWLVLQESMAFVVKIPFVYGPQCWCYLMFVLFPADKQNDNYYPRLRCPCQTIKNAIQQTASLGAEKAKSQARFARLDSHKTKPCEAELCPGLLALLPALQALCWGAGAELCATDGSIGSCKGAVSQRRRRGGGAGRTGTGHPTCHSLGCWRMMDFGVSNLSSCSFPLLMARTQHCVFTPQIITPCSFLLAARDCREKGLLLRHSQ